MINSGGSQMPALHVTEVDGIPTVWADAPGPYTGGLALRMGHADEILARHGLSHMLEHLALFGIGRPGDHANGQVDVTTTVVHSSGEPEDVADFLTRVGRQLVEPPVARLDDEKGVLRSEAARRAPYALGELTTWRWGSRTYGLEAAREFGLPLMSAESVREWAVRYVGRRNAVLWLTGPPPAGLRLSLPEGESRSAPDPWPSPVAELPGFFRSGASTVAVHGLVDRSPAAVALADVLRSRLVDDLRVSRAAAYSPDVGYRPLTGDVAAIVAFTDIVEGRATEVTDRVLETLAELTRTETSVRPEELAAYRARILRRLDGSAATGMVASSAMNLLLGAPVRTVDELRDELERLTPQMLRDAAVAAERSLLLQVPNGVPVPDSWAPAPLSTAPAVFGRGRRHRDSSALLVVADEGVTLVDGGTRLTVRHDDVAALCTWDDGGRVLIGGDGLHLTIEPTLWREGTRVVAEVDAAVSAEHRVPLGSRSADAIPRPAPLRSRLRRSVPPVRTIALTTAGGAAAGTAAFFGASFVLSGFGFSGFGGSVGLIALLMVLRTWQRDKEAH